MADNLCLDCAKMPTDEYLSQLFAARIKDAHEVGERYEKFWIYMRDVALAGGKRIRPYLTMIGYGANDERIIPIAAAQELIHIAMLMHDDIIDQDTIRHGEKNMNAHYNEEYENYLDDPQRSHYANSAALLAGDALLSEAYQAICNSSFNNQIKSRVSDQMHVSIYEVIGGELLDVEAAFVTNVHFDPLRIYRYKTSSYSFIGPLLSGAYCAGLSEQELVILRQFASNLGIAFQIQDDLLGVFGDEIKTGKSTLTDLREGKQTLLVLHHKELMNDDMHARFTAFGSDGASTEELERIKHDMDTSGAAQKTIDTAKHYFDLSRAQLNNIGSGARRDVLSELLDNLEGRKQ